VRHGRGPAAGVPRAPLEAGAFEDLPETWQAAIMEAEQNRPKLRIVASD
jgi:hypothetical protein